MTSLKATKTIARTNKYVISAIGIHPLSQGSWNSRHRSFTNIIIAHLFTLNKYQYAQIIRLNIVVNIVHRIRKGESDNQYDRNAIAVYAR